MLSLRIKRAEVALRDGRLDEACRIASDSEVQAHRKGQALIGKLVRALARRGRSHLEAGRYPQASADCEKAGELGGNADVVAELRQALAERIRQDHAVKERHEVQLAEAKHRIANGQLTLGGRRLAEMSDDSLRTHRMNDDIEARRALAESAMARAKQAVDRQDWHTAIGALREVRHVHPRQQGLDDLIAATNTHVVGRIREHIHSGRPDLARTLLTSLRGLSADHPDVMELKYVTDECARAHALLTGVNMNDWSEARATLQRVVHVCPQAVWVRELIAHLDAGLQAHSQMQSSPLGLLKGIDGDETLPAAIQPKFTARVMHEDQSDRRPTMPAHAGELPSRFLLHVDGSGSFLVARESRVTVGPAGSSGRHDVSLLADSGLPYGTIERNDEDYFLLSDGSVRLNGRQATRTLLKHGDKVALSARCGFTFLRPNAASGTALLQLAGTRLNHSDTRRVILLQREIVLGSGPSAHVRVNGLNRNIVLYVQQGALHCRSAEAVLCDGQNLDRREGIPLEKNVQIGDVTLIARAV